MELVYLTILLALVEYTIFTALVGRARAKYGIKAPAMTGHPDFERVNRVHMNTLESLIVFIPAILMFAHYIDARWAAGLGLLFVIGRALYAVGYIKAAEKRGLGAGICGLTNIALLLGALFGVVRALM
ncbi:MAG: MAPEG family protein [Gammaproteobacteria bacterium]